MRCFNNETYWYCYWYWWSWPLNYSVSGWNQILVYRPPIPFSIMKNVVESVQLLDFCYIVKCKKVNTNKIRSRKYVIAPYVNTQILRRAANKTNMYIYYDCDMSHNDWQFYKITIMITYKHISFKCFLIMWHFLLSIPNKHIVLSCLEKMICKAPVIWSLHSANMPFSNISISCAALTLSKRILN